MHNSSGHGNVLFTGGRAPYTLALGRAFQKCGYRVFVAESLKSNIYSYRLKQIDYDGTFEYSSSVDAEILSPDNFNLAQNYPNPFNPETIIEYSVPEMSVVKLSVYSILGELITTIINESVDAGYHKALFNASDLSSGTYIYQLTVSNNNSSYISAKKMLLTK